MRWLCAIAVAYASQRAVAYADPELGRVVTAPTAWLPGDGTILESSALDQRGDGLIDVAYGLGELASLELDLDSEVRAGAVPLHQVRATFRIGARQDAWFVGQPALLLGATRTLRGERTVSDVYVAASRTLGVLRVHAGARATEAADARSHMPATVRPFAALELVPPQYPKTTLVGDVAWLPDFRPDATAEEWAFGWGVRYQALTWASIELDVRHREGEGIGASTVMVRVNGVWRP